MLAIKSHYKKNSGVSVKLPGNGRFSPKSYRFHSQILWLTHKVISDFG